MNVIHAVGKCRGKRLVSAIKFSLLADGAVTTVAHSTLGIGRVHRAIQHVSNETHRKLVATPRQNVVDGKNVLTVEITFQNGGGVTCPSC